MRKKRLSNKKMLLIGFAVAAIAIVLIYYFDQNKRYWGKVVDAETGEPIVGAVVVIKWAEGEPTVAGVSTRLKDVKETLTDENGEWELRGPRGENPLGMVLSFIPFVYYTKRPEFIIYKPGYCPYPKGRRYIDVCKNMYVGDKRYGNVAKGSTTGLPRLTEREDRWKAYGIDLIITAEEEKRVEAKKKLKEFRRLLEQEKSYLWPEEK